MRLVKRALEEKKTARQDAINTANSAKQSFEDKNGVLEVYTKVLCYTLFSLITTFTGLFPFWPRTDR